MRRVRIQNESVELRATERQHGASELCVNNDRATLPSKQTNKRCAIPD